MAILNKVVETDPRAKRLPAEKQLLQVLHTCWKVRDSPEPFTLLPTISLVKPTQVVLCQARNGFLSSKQHRDQTEHDPSFGCPEAEDISLRPARGLQEKVWMAQSLWSLPAIPVAFAVFVYLNGGVVVGDKAHHVPVQHYMQIPYLLLFTAGCLAAVHFTPNRCFPCVQKLLHSRWTGLPQHSRCLIDPDIGEREPAYQAEETFGGMTT